MNPVSRQSYIQVRLAKLKIVISLVMSDSGWRPAREKTGLTQIRVHDLKHTFGRRLRAAGVSFEDRQGLLEHRSGRMTTHYSAAELTRLIEAANTVCIKGVRVEWHLLKHPVI